MKKLIRFSLLLLPFLAIPVIPAIAQEYEVIRGLSRKNLPACTLPNTGYVRVLVKVKLDEPRQLEELKSHYPDAFMCSYLQDLVVVHYIQIAQVRLDSITNVLTKTGLKYSDLRLLQR